MKRIASLALLGVLSVSGLTSAAVAADWDDYHRGGYDYRYDRANARYGFDRGLHDGAYSGHEDAIHGHSFRATDHGQFRGATDGYRGGCSKEAYKDAYRAGYMRGYSQAYNEAARGYGYRRWR